MGLVLALLPASAHGASEIPEYPTGVRPANNALVDEMVRVGLRFWSDRRVYPARPTMMLAEHVGRTSTPGVEADAGTIGTTIYLLSSSGYSPLADVQMHPREREAATALCGEIVHELGHVARLTFPDNPSDPAHSPDPDSVMASDGGDPPWVCRAWARDRANAALRRARSRTMSDVSPRFPFRADDGKSAGETESRGNEDRTTPVGRASGGKPSHARACGVQCPNWNAPGRVRTSNLRLSRPVLYPIELRGRTENGNGSGQGVASQ